MEINEALKKIADVLGKWDGKTDTIEIDPLAVIVLFLDWEETKKYLAVSMNLTRSTLDLFTKSNKEMKEVLGS